MKTIITLSLATLLTGGCKNKDTPDSEGKTGVEEAIEDEPIKETVEAADVFTGGFGESFSHSGIITISSNPHGGANRVDFEWMKFPLGSLNIRNSPPKKIMDTFSTSTIPYLKSRYGVSSAEHKELKNSHGLAYHRFDGIVMGGKDAPFKGYVKDDPDGYDILMFVFFDTRKTSNEGLEILRDMYGTYQFEFIVPRSDAKTLKPEIEAIIKTFKMADELKK